LIFQKIPLERRCTSSQWESIEANVTFCTHISLLKSGTQISVLGFPGFGSAPVNMTLYRARDRPGPIYSIALLE
jgi:hypothetical protein